jgi:sugar transferase (PEP-CTERM/EpsH1 system associated)
VEILYLSHRIPYPPNKGDKIRSYALLKHLAEHHRVHLACFIDDASDLVHAETVRGMVRGECLFVPLPSSTKWIRAGLALASGKAITEACFGGTAIKTWMKTIVDKYSIDCSVVFSSAVAPYILDGSIFDPARAILDMVDVDSDKWLQYATESRGMMRWIYRREASKLLRLERAAVDKFGATLLSSPYEAETFSELAPDHKSRIFSLSNGVDLEQFTSKNFQNPFSPVNDAIVMTGRMDYRPNADGAKWFACEVMPYITWSFPEARFYAVGANPTASLRACSGRNIVVTGQVDDIRPYIQHAAAIVAPLKIARGIQNKVLEAMAMGKPVIATPQATRSLAVTSGTELWIENEPRQFAAAVTHALRGADRLRVAHHGRKYVETHHNWRRNLSVLDELLAKLGEQFSARQPSGDAPRFGFSTRSAAKPTYLAGAQ